MRVLHRFVTNPHRCPYLPARVARLEYSFAPDLSGAEYEELMNRGCRKFGPLFFRPVCASCEECRPIRIPAAAFRPDRSQRRAWRANGDLEARLGPPIADDRRLDLYHRYHAAQALRKGWPARRSEPEEYEFSFVRNPVPSLEITLWEADRLRAVVLTDVTPNVVSGVYHFYDPEAGRAGLGTCCMLHTIDLARRLEKSWAYFGFYVSGCASMEYKARFRPCELMGADGTWRPV